MLNIILKTIYSDLHFKFDCQGVTNVTMDFGM